MLEKISLPLVAMGLLVVSGLLFIGHAGLAIKAANYAYLVIALFFLFKLFKPKT